MTFERKFAYITTHKPSLALTLSERASSYYNALDNARFITPHKPALALTLSERASSYYNALDNARFITSTNPRTL